MSFDSRNSDKLWYTGLETPVEYLEERWPDMDWRSDSASFPAGMATFFILYCFFIPMSLYVTFDFAKIFQMKFIDWDVEMSYVHDASEPAVYAKARSLSVTDLGQVEYVFSDKTGTLTRNEMKLRRVLVAGRYFGLGEDAAEVLPAQYGEVEAPETVAALYDAAEMDSDARRMLESFMLCNTVIVEQPEADAATSARKRLDLSSG